MLIIYVYILWGGSPLFPSGCYKLRDKLNIPCSAYKNQATNCNVSPLTFGVRHWTVQLVGGVNALLPAIAPILQRYTLTVAFELVIGTHCKHSLK